MNLAKPGKRSAGTVLVFVLGLAVVTIFSDGCGRKRIQTPSPPPEATPTAAPSGAPSPTPSPSPGAHASQPLFSANTKPIYVETGLATWYAPYHNHRSADGEIYDGKQLTAAHKTLPLNSVARVTNLDTGKSAILRITDRGPFVGDRILDLSPTAAKAIGLWSAGLAKVRVEVLYAPSPIDRGGRWAVQIGAFSKAGNAGKLKKQLEHRYHTAEVLQFKGSTGEWLRVRVLDDDKSRAQEVLRTTKTPEGQAFLVRLD